VNEPKRAAQLTDGTYRDYADRDSFECGGGSSKFLGMGCRALLPTLKIIHGLGRRNQPEFSSQSPLSSNQN